MHLIQTASRAASLSLLLFSHPIHAQYEPPPNTNLTLRFFPQNSAADDTTCSYRNTTDALTFTTKSTLLSQHCFDFKGLFSGNATQGFVDQGTYSGREYGIKWHLFNAEKFDPTANYTGVLYRQHIKNAGNEKSEPYHYVNRWATMYGANGCREVDSDQLDPLPWFAFNCLSEDDGNCGTLPYSLDSFRIYAPREDNLEGTCWMFAEWGAATRLESSQVLMGVFVSAVLAIWLAL
ncbi:hypothetical protein BDW02DRAFT_565510 [Decorospora gaudefroyi]|uniref:Uncharacterized protein n=1 Tax=Decorospora gaudefroyi TaxID=184978 RepID=A0A6A5KU30_9PLEO|nr:hypothetical protein BDW02DRAFT_565510 [Decorospora gaudefroyi]